MNTFDSDVKVQGKITVGTDTQSPQVSGGTGVMDLTNKPDGSIHMRTDENELPYVKHNGAAAKMGLASDCIECRFPAALTANTANTYKTYAPKGMKVTGVKRRYTSVPASSSGTVVAGITLGGNQILASSSENEEGLTNDTLTAHNLTGTAENLLGDQGDEIVITLTSNNADMTGGTGVIYYIYFDHN